MLLPIPNCEGYYASSDGLIYSTVTVGRYPRTDGPLKKLIEIPSSRPYLRVNTGRGKEDIHALVLEAFVGPRPSGMHCRHLDGNPHNNAIDNLKWGTVQENQVDRERHGTGNQGSRNPNYKHGKFVKRKS